VPKIKNNISEIAKRNHSKSNPKNKNILHEITKGNCSKRSITSAKYEKKEKRKKEKMELVKVRKNIQKKHLYT